MNRRQLIVLMAKIIFALGVVVWLFHKVDPHRVWESIRRAHGAPMLLGLILLLVTVVIAAWRWQRVLEIFDIKIPLGAAVCIVQIGQFFAMFLPGPVGDDLTRMLYVSRLAPGRVGEACTTVVLDRFLGLTSVLLLAVFCVPWQWSLLSTSRQTYLLGVVILSASALTCIGGAIFFAAGHPTHRWFARRLRSLPAHSLRDEAARIWGLLCDNKLAVSKVVGAALATQLIHCFIFYLAGLSVGIHSSFLVWLTFIPIVLAANALPITIAGIGVRDYLLVLFLGVVAGVDNALAFAASFVMFSMLFTICLLGGLLYIFYKPKSLPAASK
jgi:uncharacterized membrane protein YbhN (UPF0104 family)